MNPDGYGGLFHGESWRKNDDNSRLLQACEDSGHIEYPQKAMMLLVYVTDQEAREELGGLNVVPDRRVAQLLAKRFLAADRTALYEFFKQQGMYMTEHPLEILEAEARRARKSQDEVQYWLEKWVHPYTNEVLPAKRELERT